MSTSKFFYTFFIAILIHAISSGQATNNEKIQALNNYINFSNESTHGLLTVHRLLVSFNTNINKYVDLPDQQVNFYSNKDLPKDVFDDPENWFYDTSPYEWYDKINNSKNILPIDVQSKLNKTAAEMKVIISAVDKLRFDLEDQIKTLDLNKRENLSLVYDKLESGVKLYKDYYVKQLILETGVDNYYKTSRATLDALYNKEDDNFNELIDKHKLAVNKFNAIQLSDYNSTRLINSRVQMYWGNIKRQAAEAILSESSFAESETLPEEFKLYDKYYYYYNFSLINKFNRYGNGIVFEINRIIEYLGAPMIRFFEVPHYFKVVYPKLLEKTEFLAASDPVVKSLPKIVKGRNVVAATRTINVDSFLVDFKMYDHKIIDKDVVSLSFNGDWIVENFEISEKPYDFTLKLNSVGKNFLLLHADDMGRQPPATIALSYFYKGKKEVIILNSDTVKSEVIEIVVQ